MKRNGFTLVELLVVIGILAVLMGILLASIGGTTDSARAAKCLANMKNLAVAIQSYGTQSRFYPYAGSIMYMDVDLSQGRDQSKIIKYYERTGWISRASQGYFPSQSKKEPPSISMYTEDEELGEYAVKNGALWPFVNGSRSVYICPLHAIKCKHVRWSYLMNAFFGWNAAENFAYGSRHHGYEYDRMSAAERMLLFSEVPFQGPGEWFPSGSGGSMDTDAVLQYNGADKAPTVGGKGRRNGTEHVGANHKNGKNWFAHVVFVDGHVEKLRCSTDNGVPLNSDNLRDLTTWLCTGQSVSFTGKRYQKLD